MRYATVMAIFCATAATAAPPNDDAPRIIVAGHGSVLIPPDVATLSFGLRGEGRSPDAATQTLVAMRQAVEHNLAAIGIAADAVHTGSLSMDQVRDKGCDQGSGDDDDGGTRARLSEGACAIIGYVARLDATVKMPPKDAGTAGGLMARAGANEVRVEDFDLGDDRAARKAAVTAALADASARAEAIAAGSGVRLGPVISVQDDNARTQSADIVVTAERNAAPAVDAPPIVVSLTPAPVERTADLTVTYAIGR